jgi:Ca2+-dependent lipid-binding protein
MRPALVDTDVTQSGRLFLEVTGGRNLKNMELFGKQDPYMKINFKAYKVRTKTHQSGGRTPVWNQTFSFELDGKDPDIMIECYDEDPGKDDFIGGAAVNIQQIVNGKGSEVFVPIVNKKGVNTGEVGFKAKFAQYRPAILKFKLVDAKGLPSLDGRQLAPYVIFYVDGDKANKVLAKSRVHKNGGANPVWNQDFNFKLTGREQFLDLDVWDEDVSADFSCGNARLRFVDLRQAAPGTQRFPLTRPGKQSSATIGVAVEFAPIP